MMYSKAAELLHPALVRSATQRKVPFQNHHATQHACWSWTSQLRAPQAQRPSPEYLRRFPSRPDDHFPAVRHAARARNRAGILKIQLPAARQICARNRRQNHKRPARAMAVFQSTERHHRKMEHLLCDKARTFPAKAGARQSHCSPPSRRRALACTSIIPLPAMPHPPCPTMQPGSSSPCAMAQSHMDARWPTPIFRRTAPAPYS